MNKIKRNKLKHKKIELKVEINELNENVNWIRTR